MTPRTLEAVYEQGVLRPLEHLELPEHFRVTVTISDASGSTQQATASCYELADQAGMVGAVRGAPTDLSSNPDYLRGFGGNE